MSPGLGIARVDWDAAHALNAADALARSTLERAGATEAQPRGPTCSTPSTSGSSSQGGRSCRSG
jgi:hypothetical protein